MKMNIALYSGSFDPFTLRDLEVLQQAIQKYDEVIINVVSNQSTQPFFTVEERIKMIDDALETLPDDGKITIINNNALAIDVALEFGANALVSEIRYSSDDLLNDMALAIIQNKIAQIRGCSSEFTMDLISIKDSFLQTITPAVVMELWQKKEYILLSAMVPTSVYNHMIMADISAYIDKIFIHYDDKRIAKKMLFNAYSERGYHNLMHIGDMLNMLAIYCQQTEKTFCAEKYLDVILAILWHDIIIYPAQLSAEQQSVNGLLHLTGEWTDNITIGIDRDEVTGMILATQVGAEAKSHKQKLIADLDKAVLGSDFTPMWIRYSTGVREEYWDYDDKEYLQGRIEFLQKLHAQPQIYQTDWFVNKFEAKAKANIHLAICRHTSELHNAKI